MPLIGNPGTGKPHMAVALGLAACAKGKRGRFTTATALVIALLEAGQSPRCNTNRSNSTGST